jgi:hypothetical protein
MTIKIKFLSLCLALLLLAVPLLTACDGEKPTGTLPSATGGTTTETPTTEAPTTETPTTAAPPPAEPIEGGPIATHAEVGEAWRTYVVDPEAPITWATSSIGLNEWSSILFYRTEDTEALAAILEELRGLEEHVIGVFEPNQKWWKNMAMSQGGLTFYVTGEAYPACNVWMDKNFLRVSTLESSCCFLLDFDTAEVTEAIQTLVGRDTGTINGFLPVFG